MKSLITLFCLSGLLLQWGCATVLPLPNQEQALAEAYRNTNPYVAALPVANSSRQYSYAQAQPRQTQPPAPAYQQSRTEKSYPQSGYNDRYYQQPPPPAYRQGGTAKYYPQGGYNNGYYNDDYARNYYPPNHYGPNYYSSYTPWLKYINIGYRHYFNNGSLGIGLGF